ncbi:hypothetical protein [Tepidibacillus marianensis]|uniref:hypothetical protein n=1 Tax=Tepidibacillus marianensis TaxID=3131995 RepID=UPI0030CFCDBC
MKPIIIEKIPKKVTVKMDLNPLIISSEVIEKHNQFWKEKINENPSLRNGEVFTITNIEQDTEELKVTVTKTDYKHYLYTLYHEDCLSPCKVIYTCASVITNDNYIVFGKMNKNSSTPGRLQFTGGGIDETDFNGETFDLVQNIGKEINEEMGLDINCPYTRHFFPKFVKHKGTHDFWAVMFELSVDYSVQELDELFQRHNQQLIENGDYPEFDKLIFVSLEKESIESFIQNEKAPMVDYLTPILLKYVE